MSIIALISLVSSYGYNQQIPSNYVFTFFNVWVSIQTLECALDKSFEELYAQMFTVQTNDNPDKKKQDFYYQVLFIIYIVFKICKQFYYLNVTVRRFLIQFWDVWFWFWFCCEVVSQLTILCVMRWFAPLRKDNQLLMASEKVELIKLDIY
jgi:hypothetical protein